MVQSYFVNYVTASEKLNIKIPLAKSSKLLVNLLVEDNGKCDGYIKINHMLSGYKLQFEQDHCGTMYGYS